MNSKSRTRVALLLTLAGLVVMPGCVTATMWHGTLLWFTPARAETPTKVRRLHVQGLRSAEAGRDRIAVTVAWEDGEARTYTYDTRLLAGQYVPVEPLDARDAEYSETDRTMLTAGDRRIYLRTRHRIPWSVVLEIHEAATGLVGSLLVPARTVEEINHWWYGRVLMTPLTLLMDAATLPFVPFALIYLAAS